MPTLSGTRCVSFSWEVPLTHSRLFIYQVNQLSQICIYLWIYPFLISPHTTYLFTNLSIFYTPSQVTSPQTSILYSLKFSRLYCHVLLVKSLIYIFGFIHPTHLFLNSYYSRDYRWVSPLGTLDSAMSPYGGNIPSFLPWISAIIPTNASYMSKGGAKWRLPIISSASRYHVPKCKALQTLPYLTAYPFFFL